MYLYLIPIIISIYGILQFDINSKIKGKIFLWNGLFLYMTLFMGLRYCVGGDTINYMGVYEWIPTLDDYTFISLNEYDPGFNFLMSIGKTITSDFVGFQLIHIILLNSLLFYAIKEYGQYRFTIFLGALFIFYYYFTTEILRESIAVLIFVLNYRNLIKRRWIKYYILVTLSILFHRSAMFLIFLPLLTWIKFNRTYIFILAAVIILGVSIQKILNSFVVFDFIFQKLTGYIDENSQGKFADIMRLMRLSVFPLLFSIYVKFGQKKVHLKFENMISLLVIFGLFSLFNPIIFSRMCNYFIVFFVMSFADTLIILLKNNHLVLREWVLLFSIGFIITYGSSYIMYNYYERLVPYYSVFNPHYINRDNFHK